MGTTKVNEFTLVDLIPLDKRQFYEIALENRKNDKRTPSQRKRDELNREKNWLDPGEYNCRVCNNRGYEAEVIEKDGYEYIIMPECKCMEIRRAIWRMKRSGLDKVIKKYTLEGFDCREDWQRIMVAKAKKYVSEGINNGQWFYAGGQPGCGKTHICTAIAREALYKFPVIYMMWEEESKKLKAVINDAEEYQSRITVFKSIEVLYIDDLFKPTVDDYGNQRGPTPADIRLAFEIINYRYINRKATVISSEWYIDALANVDEATASRIAERCGEYQIIVARDRRKNHRFQVV